MMIFKQKFAPGTRVSVFYTEEGTSVRVYTPALDPTWIPKEKRSNPHVTVQQIKEELLKLIRIKPGHTRTHYTQLQKKDGGIKGSRERKEEMFKELVDEKLIVVKPLDKPIARQNHAVYPAEYEEV